MEIEDNRKKNTLEHYKIATFTWNLESKPLYLA